MRGVICLPASIYRSKLMDIPIDRFRIVFGQKNIEVGLHAFCGFLESTDVTHSSSQEGVVRDVPAIN